MHDPRAPALRAAAGASPSNIRVLAHAGSIVEALNAGLEAATGAYVVSTAPTIVASAAAGAPGRLPQGAPRDRRARQRRTGTLDTKLAAGATKTAPPTTRRPGPPEAIEVRLRSGPCFDHGSAIARRADVRQAGGFQPPRRLAARPRSLAPPDAPGAFAKLPTRLYLRRPRG